MRPCFNEVASADGGGPLQLAFGAQWPAAAEFIRWRIMKVATSILLSVLLILAAQVCAQRFPTNNITRAEAIKAASRLRVGMKEEAAAKVLTERGLQSGGSVGCSHGWTRFYLLSDGCTLGLEIAPKQARADGKWADGLLESASIQSNGVKIVSIALTNAP